MAYLLKLEEYSIPSLKLFPTSIEMHIWGYVGISCQKKVMNGDSHDTIPLLILLI